MIDLLVCVGRPGGEVGEVPEATLGIAVAPYPDGKGAKIFVCHSPHIYVFEDKDGDLKADGPPKILLTGFGGIDHDHGVHGIHIGPDGIDILGNVVNINSGGTAAVDEAYLRHSITDPKAQIVLGGLPGYPSSTLPHIDVLFSPGSGP